MEKADISFQVDKRISKAVFLLLLILFVLQSCYLAQFYSKLDDEDLSITAGLNFWRVGSYPKGMASLPLGPILKSLPHYLGIHYHPLDGSPSIAARAVTIVFGLLTLILLYLFARKLYGDTAALVPLLFLVFHPQMTSSAAVGDAEVIASFFLLALSFIFWEFCCQKDSWLCVPLGLMTGLAVVTSALAAPLLILLPIALLWQLDRSKWRNFVLPMFYFLLPLVLLLLVAAPTDEITRKPYLLSEGFVYLLGETVQRDTVHYLPLLLLFKSPPILLLTLFILFIDSLLRQSFDEKRALCLGVPLVSALGWIFLTRIVQPDGRAFLPLLPLLCLLTGGLLELKANFLSRRQFVIALLIILASPMATAYSTHPFGLSYLNSIANILGGGGDVVAGSNITRGQGEKALKEYAKALPPDKRLFAAPWPLIIPACGYVAVDRDSLRPFRKGAVPVNEWVIPFGPSELLGPWAIYDVGIERMKARFRDDPRDAGGWYLYAQYLLYEEKYDELGEHLPKATVFARQAFVISAALHLLQGERGKAWIDMQRYHYLRKGLEGEVRLWYEITESLVGANKLSKNENLMRAVAWTYLLTEPIKDKLLIKEKNLPLFDQKIDEMHSHPYLRLIGAMRSLQKKNFDEASKLFQSLQFEEFGESFRYKSYWCKRYVALRDSTSELEKSRSIMILAHQLGEPEMAWKILKDKLVEKPLAIETVKILCRLRRLRRTIIAPFDSGNGTIFDRRDKRGRITINTSQ